MRPQSWYEARPRIGVRDARFRQALEKARLARNAARAEAVKPVGETFVDVIERVAPADTNRYIRGWQLAANDAGLAPRAVRPVKPSKRAEEWIAALEKQVAYWANKAERARVWIELADKEDAQRLRRKDGKLKKRRRSMPYYKKLVRERKKALREVAKSEATLAEALGAETFLLFDKGGFAKGRAARYGKTGKRFRTSIRTKVYGGAGSIEDVGGTSIITLHNLEPHATIISKSVRHGKPVEFAMAAVKALGGRQITRRYAKVMAELSGLEPNRKGLKRGEGTFKAA